MASPGSLDAESESFEPRPFFTIGQHDSNRRETLTDDHYRHILNSGFHFATTPITNDHFKQRVVDLYKSFLKEREQWGLDLSNQSLPGPVVSTLTDEDTNYGPGTYVGSLVAYCSPWIDLCSSNPLIASISRQVLNLELAYASFAGARNIIIPGPRRDDGNAAVVRYARAVREGLQVASRINIIIHMPMYREPRLEEKAETLSQLVGEAGAADPGKEQEIDIFTSWDSWHTIRSVCDYAARLYVALRIPRRVPEKVLQGRWFAEPLYYLTVGAEIFQKNPAGYPSLSRHHQELIASYMRFRNPPSLLLSDVGPDADAFANQMALEFPSLAEASQALKENRRPTVPMNPYVSYIKHLERSQEPFSALDTQSLLSFQDWLQSPLQPLADNLESATYEVFEGDPVKYNQYELAIAKAMIDWREQKLPTAQDGTNSDLVVAVAGAGRGPLVTRVLRAAESTGTSIQLWALEKNQNAYVYLLGMNKRVWNNKVTVVKTDMRGWEGPKVPGYDSLISKVDILVTELLGSFGDNELSPECLDGIQRHLSQPHGISIPSSYTAHLSPIATPKIFADLSSRVTGTPDAFETPWVTLLYAIDFVAQKVPDHPRFQQAWEFSHPVGLLRADEFAEEAGMAAKYVPPGVGSMYGSSGANDHNTRYCHLTFVCPTRGVIHGLAGYFESVLYAPHSGKEPVEISILPDQIDRKSKDMISWFPIFFPLKKPMYFPQDTELEVSMWRQTDDTKVWYEWIVEAYAWVGPKTRLKVGESELHTSRNVGCRF
ncbi:methyltransferase [Echria macrotheca]|uniref:Protein arginine N-methyltransferase n=1 Tax=Echria macrotheca TaxID=438768 RepID=A0AAJ0BPX2_9PEZI|nr:methyltransferase [Echria macrotheca]